MSPFVKALVFTSVPIVAVSVISALPVVETIGLLWFLAVIVAIGFLIAAAVNFARGNRQIAAGILAGVGIGAVALGLTCFAI